MGRHQGAHGNARSPDATRDRRGDGGIAQVDAGRLERRLGLLGGRLGRGNRLAIAFHLRLHGLERGLGHLGIGDGLVALAGRDGLFPEGRFEPLAVRPGKVEGGLLPGHVGATRLQRCPRPVGVLLRGGEIGSGIVQGCLKRRRIDLVERLSGLDLGAFGKGSLLDEAPHLRTHLGDEVGGGPAGQFCCYRQRPGLDRDNGHLRRPHLRRRA